jgi:hypothetical protein
VVEEEAAAVAGIGFVYADGFFRKEERGRSRE